MSLRFLKMNGLGNDFVVVPADDQRFEPTPAQVRAIADRVEGLGCDQVISISRSNRAHARMRIWNADGAEVEHCGNGARCVAWLMMRAMALDQVRIEFPAGVLEAFLDGEMRVTVDMGRPRLNWAEIPLAGEMDTREVPLNFDPSVGAPGCVSMGNPHATFFLESLDSALVARVGPIIESHWLFPKRVNAGFAQVQGRNRIRLKVWERGVGLTKACGTGACAAVVAAHRRGLTERRAIVELDGGELFIDWSEADGHVRMTGPVSLEEGGLLPSLETFG